MKPIITERLTIRNWQKGDRAAFHRLNSDETVMRFFPFRRNRIESNLIMETVRNKISNNGYGFAAVELTRSGQVIGFTGISDFTEDLPFTPAVEIGWRFLPESWGNGYATESAHAWLEHAFNNLDIEKIVSFAVVENTASIAVMKRLGMRHYPELDFDHPSVSNEQPALKPHVLYAINKDQFDTQNN